MASSLDFSPSIAAAKPGWLSGVAASLRENSPIIFCVVLYLVAANSLSAYLGRPHRVFDQLAGSYEGFVSICVAALALAFCVWILHLTLVRKVSIQTREAWRCVLTEFLSRDRILLALPILVLWPVLARAFSLVKALIPAIQPYYLDPALFEWDRAIHFGHDPWTLLQPFFGYPFVTYAIDKLYALWLFVMYFAVLLQITSTGNRMRRAQFLLGSVLAWTLIGGLAATLLSSVGPCYYGLVVGQPDPYAPLMTYLRDTVQNTQIPLLGSGHSLHLIAVTVQDLLWDFYQEGDFGFGRGISAAPSMHVASTWLVARMLQSYGRAAAIFGWSFFALILLGSVHLGWHYALDGYIAIAGAWIIWRLVGWWLNRPAVARFLWPQGSAAKAA